MILQDLWHLPLIDASLPLATDNGTKVALASVDVVVMKRQHASRELTFQYHKLMCHEVKVVDYIIRHRNLLKSIITNFKSVTALIYLSIYPLSFSFLKP